MKIITSVITALVIPLLLVAPLKAHEAEVEENKTVFQTDIFRTSVVNGNAWVRMDRQSKVMYLTGIEDGVGLLIAEMDSFEHEKLNARAAIPALYRLMVKRIHSSDVAEEIDTFYQQASNRRIPVVEAYRYVLKKFRGASSEELLWAQSVLRRKYNE